ncbi:conjugal transfer protein TraD [Sphingomonas sanguinis]|uniref:conjugal transfer protein TraD n=1 Tax=Sphingomonas sanguinis TaxID=33051 RepID=UPI003A100EE9
MAANHLRQTSDVGTTYKRALRRFHLSRDAFIPRYLSTLQLIERPDNWIILAPQRKDDAMRKPRDYHAELKALDDKARQLKARKREQLGELAIATGADALPIEQLAGALLLAVDETDTSTKEAQRTRGAAFFRAKSGARPSARQDDSSHASDISSPRPAPIAPGAA